MNTLSKESFLAFKEDMKIAAIDKHKSKRLNKEWYNAGFASEEEYFEEERRVCAERNRNCDRIHKCSHASFIANMAYYVAKHQLAEEQAETYIRECLKHSPHFIETILWYGKDLMYTMVIKWVNEIIDRYAEPIVCTDQQQA